MLVVNRRPNVTWCRSREARRLVAIGILVAVLAALLSVLVPSGDALALEPLTTTRYQQGDSHILKTGSWSDFAKTLASGGSYGRSSTSGATVTMYFHGTRLDWIGMKGTTTGTADVYLDGSLVKTVNLAAPTAVYNVPVWSTEDLPEGDYKVEIVRRSDNPSTKYITLDAVDVVGKLLYPRPTITRLNPSYGPLAGGVAVVITGKWFYDISGPDAVTFDGVSADELYGELADADNRHPSRSRSRHRSPYRYRRRRDRVGTPMADDYTYKERARSHHHEHHPRRRLCCRRGLGDHQRH